MSLQLWMPLMGDLRNQGLGDYSISSLGTISWVAGKLNSQAMRAGDGTQVVNGIRIEDTFTDLLNGDYSVAVWVKPYGTHVHYNGSIFSSGNWNTAKKRWAFGVSQDNSKVDVLCSDYNIYVTCAVPVNEWTHLVCTCGSDRIVKLYKNGEYVASVDRSASNAFDSDNVFTCIGRESYASGYFSFNGAIQDFRLYDHCLSPMEVKQISQGLVLHYPLNRNGWGQENLATQYVVPGSNGPLVTTTAGRTVYYGKYGITIPTTENADTYFSIYMKQALESGKKYTLSCEVNGLSNGTYYNFPLFAQNNSSMGLLKLDHNGLCSLTFTMNYTGTVATSTVDGVTLYRLFMDDISRSIASGQGTITVTNIKLEEGDKVTPWCPASIDSSYTTMGLNSTTEYDCSGFCNNGTRTGTFNWTSNTPKYAVSQVFNGSNNAIQTPSLPTMITDKNYTIAVWIYKTVIGSKGYQTIYGGPSGFEIEARNGGANETKFVPLNWGRPMASYELNEWNHCVFVHSDADCKIYLNGEYIATGTAKASNPTGNYFIGAWNTATQQNFDGLMSDFRIYATALSADDVKSLYQNCATIDPDGTIRGQIRS